MDTMLSAFKNLCARTPGVPNIFAPEAMKRERLYEPTPELKKVPGIDCFVQLFRITMDLPDFERACFLQPERRREEMTSMIMRLQSLGLPEDECEDEDGCDEGGEGAVGNAGGEGGASNVSGVSAQLAGGLTMGTQGERKSVGGAGGSSSRESRPTGGGGTRAKRTCMACGKSCSQLCGRCKCAYFCDVLCQKRAWKSHKPECKE